MSGKPKKTVSEEYKQKLLEQIALLDKRIEEALNKQQQNFVEDESFEEHITNPCKFKNEPSLYELQQQEASLRARVSMTLELNMLTIMESEVNVMVTPPEISEPVSEAGVWHEVMAECKVDLIPFAITFFFHKPVRESAPISYRNVAVTLIEPGHQKELAESILPTMQKPNLAMQVLQSYATAFRSRLSTLEELAARYEDKLQTQPMPEGGYRVRFLGLVQLDWTLVNPWSPVEPFNHRMKFDVEYIPKHCLIAVGKLYQQLKDPCLETSERTAILSQIFDKAAGPAEEIQDDLESDPETAGSLHERRTTIKQEPDVPHIEHPPKQPSGKDNKAQSRKTDMAMLFEIFDIGLEAAGPAKEIQDDLESDLTETAGSLHERRATLKQEPDVTVKTGKEPVKATVDKDDAARKGDGKIPKFNTASNYEVVGTKNTNKNGGSSKDSSEATSNMSKKNTNVKKYKCE